MIKLSILNVKTNRLLVDTNKIFNFINGYYPPKDHVFLSLFYNLKRPVSKRLLLQAKEEEDIVHLTENVYLFSGKHQNLC